MNCVIFYASEVLICGRANGHSEIPRVCPSLRSIHAETYRNLLFIYFLFCFDRCLLVSNFD